ncbi:MAG: capsular exopolysaccharide biosynthesis protein, partial [Planctomycetota bacterium]
MNSQSLAPNPPAVAKPSPRPAPSASVPTVSPPLKRNTGLRAAQFIEPMNPQGLLLAFKRRWRTAVVIAIPVAVVAAMATYLTTPAPFTAFALLRVAAVEQRLVFKTAEEVSDFQTYRRTQMALIKSRFVMNAALRKSNVAALSMVREQDFPVAWLEQAIQVDAHESPEILRISLTGDRPNELAEIVNAVKDAYLEEVVNAERKLRIARLNDLERIFEQTEEKVRQKEGRVNNLAQELGTGDAKALTIKQQMAMEYFAQLRREHARVRFELMRLQVGDDASATSNEDDPLTSSGDGPKQGAVAAVRPPRSPAAAADAEDEFESAVPATTAKIAGASGLIDDPRAVSAQRRVKQLKDLIAKFERQVINQNHPTLEGYRKELAELQKVASGADDDVAAAPGMPKRRSKLDLLKRQEQLLREELDKYSALVKNIGTSSFELEAMKTEMEQVSKVSDKVGAEMEALRIELQSPTRISMLQEAEVPQTRSMSKKNNLTSAAGLGGLGMVFLLVSVIEFHNRRITDPKDMTQTLGLELLGALPAMPRPLLKIGTPAASRMVMWNNALIESVDSIRSILLHIPDAEQRKVIMIASATAGEGKTTFA